MIAGPRLTYLLKYVSLSKRVRERMHSPVQDCDWREPTTSPPSSTDGLLLPLTMASSYLLLTNYYLLLTTYYLLLTTYHLPPTTYYLLLRRPRRLLDLLRRARRHAPPVHTRSSAASAARRHVSRRRSRHRARRAADAQAAPLQGK